MPRNLKIYAERSIRRQSHYYWRPKSSNEIKEYIWIDKNYRDKGIKLGSVLALHIVPKLIEASLM